MADKYRKPTINTFGLSPELARALEPVKQSIEMITGARNGMKALKKLSSDATTAEIAERINEVISRLNASGKAE